jgi:serine/threonine protein kinase
MCPTRTSSKEPIEKAINHLIPHAPHQTRHLKDATIFKIQQYLGRHEDFKQWSDKPRLFSLLRMLQCDDNILNRFLDAGVNDYLLPLNEHVFKGLRVKISWTEFEAAQRYILLDPDDMSESYLQDNPSLHRNLEDGDLVFKEAGELGEGGTATVSTVQLTAFDNPNNGRLYACKRLARDSLSEQKRHLQPFIDELHILRKISHPSTVSHPHMVRLVASYTDLTHFAFVLHPVADRSLKDMLESANLPGQCEDSTSLRQWFGCLASALVHLHGQSIRHKDIKPGNILLHNGTVYLCDFGISLDWNGSHPTTEGPSARTRGYCAPEVLDAKARDNRSDVWSLGRVFCDMLTILAGGCITELLERIGGDLHGIYNDRCQNNLHSWLSGFSLESTPNDYLAISIQQLVEKMVSDNGPS